MGEKQAWVNVSMTDEEVEEWLRIRDKGFARFAFRYGVVIVGALAALLLAMHYAAKIIPDIPDSLRTLPLMILFGLPVTGPFLACLVCGMAWAIHVERYRNTVRQQSTNSKHTTEHNLGPG